MRLHKPSLLLGAKYLAIIMLISVLFSINMYATSIQEIGRGYGRIGPGANRSLDSEEFLTLREAQLELARDALKSRLIIINVAILFLGGFLSYYLASKSLGPIEKARESQARFTSDASHELRTPITAIRTETESYLLEPKPTLREAKHIMQSTIEELDKLTSLTEGLLRLARASGHSLKLSTTTIQKLSEDCIARMQSEATKKDIDVALDSNDEAQNITVDVDLVSDAVNILLENAIKYSERGSEVKLSVRADKHTFILSVQDQGAGIKQSQLPHIFERFYQGDSSRNKSHSPGFGIGLSIVKSVVELHRGTIEVQSTRGQGSTFTIALPHSVS